jgi:hypothetical protein
MKTKLALIFLTAITLFSSSAFTEPHSGLTTITAIAPYIESNHVHIAVSSPVLCGTDTFRIDLSKLNGKAAYAAALAAMMTNKKVTIEISNAKGCTGWGTELQSITVFAQ